MKLFFILPYFVYSFNAIEVKWEGSNPLQWEDFSGRIDSSSEYDAWTWSGFNYNYTWKRIDGEIKVHCTAYGFFDPFQSWVKGDKKSKELLEHEQLHFDISELHSRYFEQRVKAFPFSDEVSIEMDSIYTVTFEELLATQIEYDKESEHYRNKAEQKRWENFVKSELENLKEFE